MRTSRSFKRTIERLNSGRFRWCVEARMTGDVIGSGLAKSLAQARMESLQFQIAKKPLYDGKRNG